MARFGVIISLLFLSACSVMQLEDLSKDATLNEPQKMIQWLQKCAKSCKEADRKIAEDLYKGYQELYSVADKNPNYKGLGTEQKQTVDFAKDKIRLAFLKILTIKENRDSLSEAYAAIGPKGFYFKAGSENEIATTVESAVSRLLSKTSTRATGFYLQGLYREDFEALSLPVVESYFYCLRENSLDVDCQRKYKMAVSNYSRPWCTAKDLKNLQSIYLIKSAKDSIFNLEFKIFDKYFYRSNRMIIAKNQIQSLVYDESNVDFVQMFLHLEKRPSEVDLSFSNLVAIKILSGDWLPGRIRHFKTDENGSIFEVLISPRPEFRNKLNLLCPNPKKSELPDSLKIN